MSQVVYGIHAVQSLIKHNSNDVERIYYDQQRKDQRLQSLIDQARHHHIAVEACDKKFLHDKADGQKHQGVVAIATGTKVQLPLEQMLQQLSKPALLLVLDGVTDPHNLGACLRTADAAGADALIIPKDKSATINATVRKVACGAADTVPVYEVTNLSRTLQQLKQFGVWVIGTAGEAEQYIHHIDLKEPTAIVMGAEGKGLRRLTREQCDHLAKLPMAGSVSSLNVSVATGICLFEAVRQRQIA